MHLEQFKGLLDQITQIVSFPLAIVNLVSKVSVFSLEQIHDWQNLSIVWHESLSNSVRAGNKSLQDFKSDGNDLWVSRIKSSLDWNNQLWNNWENLGTTLFKHIKYTLYSQESIWVHLFTDTLEEDWQVMMIVQLLDFYLPVDLVLRTVLNCNWQISSVVEEAEFTDWDLSSNNCSSSWLLDTWFVKWLVQTGTFSTKSITLLENGSASSSN